MTHCLISLGANLGNPEESIQAAVRLLSDDFGRGNLRFSHLYRTPPIGGPLGQAPFLNAVVAVETDLDPFQVWRIVRNIESALGRQRQQRWEARRIDVDVLLHGDRRIWTPHFKIPHPRMCMRAFILEPACEVAALWRDPVSDCSIQELATYLQAAQGTVTLLSEIQNDLNSIQRQLNHPNWLQIQLVKGPLQLKPSSVDIGLQVIATRSPDPENIAWEDYSRPWARCLDMTELQNAEVQSADNGDRWRGPRYLISSSDLKWAAHEVESAQAAMTCYVEKWKSIS